MMPLPPATAAFFPGPTQNRMMAKNLEFEETFESEMADGFSSKMHTALMEMGVPPRLQKAVPNRVPKEIHALKCFQSFPAQPFGLVGEGGIGKSCAIVQAIKSTLVRDWTDAGPSRMEESSDRSFEGYRVVHPKPKTQFKWVGWPAYASKMKSFASRREWLDPQASVEALVHWATRDAESRVLILDDLGMESIKEGSYTTEQLELLVDELYNWECRVFWTSNRCLEDMEKSTFYGYRLVSRLTGLSPDAMIPNGLPDLRLHKVT